MFGIGFADGGRGVRRQRADLLAAAQPVDDQDPFDAGEVDHHVPVAIAVAGDEQGVALLVGEQGFDDDGLAAFSGLRVVFHVGVLGHVVHFGQPHADDIGAGQIISIFGIGGEYRDHVFEGGGADIDIDPIIPEGVHQVDDFFVQTQAGPVGDADDASFAGQRSGASPFDLANGLPKVVIIRFFRYSHHFGGGHVFEEEQHPGVADFGAEGVANGFIGVVHLGAEIFVFGGLFDVGQAHQAVQANIVVVEVGVAADDVFGDGVDVNALAGGVVIVFQEGILGNVLFHQVADFSRRQFERQILDLVRIKGFFRVVHDAGVVPVKNGVRFLGRVVIGTLDAIVVNQFLHGLVGVGRPFPRR